MNAHGIEPHSGFPLFVLFAPTDRFVGGYSCLIRQRIGGKDKNCRIFTSTPQNKTSLIDLITGCEKYSSLLVEYFLYIVRAIKQKTIAR